MQITVQTQTNHRSAGVQQRHPSLPDRSGHPGVVCNQQSGQSSSLSGVGPRTASPGSTQQSNLSRKQIQRSQTFDIALDHICATAAEKGYDLTGLVKQIVTLLPNQKVGDSTGSQARMRVG
ncbi:hypothetical protein [Aquitalea denitrificans]|uniref:hypothetical protein n=1 Tax=Aquitalea denitrificans TaxID=519081 RepID=UPI001356BEA8|nr:hypothetical protein [Aquitalea denitrificans]